MKARRDGGHRMGMWGRCPLDLQCMKKREVGDTATLTAYVNQMSTTYRYGGLRKMVGEIRANGSPTDCSRCCSHQL
ncbi:hypothetical protein SORBI_3002G066100 [Sorghum bicolor]|uniref:Uncharacterized protein n=1 Tax=Sorghum bicolor TaxID=4558 RepID=A0A1W0W2P5_SORBI|nr:hypothetical protein SORBI_3002G066100 [Sorghum bicolor]